MKSHSLEDYVQHADELADDVVHAWVVNAKAGNSAYLTPELKGVFDKAFEYRQSKKFADNHRQLNFLSDDDATAEHISREIFAAAYKRWVEHQMSVLVDAL